MKKKLLGMLCVMTCICCMASGVTGVATDEKNQTEVETESSKIELEDGVYTVDFDTDSAMFHVNESCEGKGILTVEDGKATLHISLVSKNIVNLFVGVKDDVEKEDAEILEPTIDTVTYSDGYVEDVFGFDVPVTVLDEEFDLAILGKKGTWYDHKVSISNPEVKEEK